MNFVARHGFHFQKANKASKNRVVLAPLTHNMSSQEGELSENEIDWLAQCASGGFGLLITAATMVSPLGRCWPGQPGLFTDSQTDAFRRIADAAHQHEALALVQLHHGGIRAEYELTGHQPMGPSHYQPDEFRPYGAREMSSNDIERLIQDFVDAAERAYRAGMDGVEIHAAFNFILSNFSNSLLNRRQDEWGGSAENRHRLLVTIVAKIRQRLPRTFLVGVRLSPENYAHYLGIDIDEQVILANRLVQEDIDYLHLSLHDSFKKPAHISGGETYLLSWLRQQIAADLPLIVAGKVYNLADADKAIGLGADFVALGTAAIGNPDWVNKVNAGQELIPAPYNVSHLSQIGFTQQSIEYLSSIRDLVAE